jgi:hypothetical protein
MLHDHRPDLRVSQQPLELRPRPAQARTNLRNRHPRRKALLRCPRRETTDLPLEILALLRGPDARVQPDTLADRRATRVDQDRARRGLPRRNRQRAVLEPLPRRLIMDALLAVDHC